MNTKQLVERIFEEARSDDPDNEVKEVIAKWKNHDFTVKVNGKWQLEGFIMWFTFWQELACAVDPSLPNHLTPQCFDPIVIARLFGFPIKEFTKPSLTGATRSLKSCHASRRKKWRTVAGTDQHTPATICGRLDSWDGWKMKRAVWICTTSCSIDRLAANERIEKLAGQHEHELDCTDTGKKVRLLYETECPPNPHVSPKAVGTTLGGEF